MSTSKSSDKGYTIAEAAEKLGVPKKNLRHALARPDRKARLVREYRNTKKGLVSVELVPEDLLADIAQTVAQYAPTSAAPTPEPAVGDEDAVELPAATGEDPVELPEPDDAAALDLERALGIDLAAFAQPDDAFSDISEAEAALEEQTAVATDTIPDEIPEPVIEAEPENEAVTEPVAEPVAEATVEADVASTEIAASAPAELPVTVEAVQDLHVPHTPNAADTMLVVATYERLLAEKEGRLADLRNALEAERENSRRLAEALAREQTLRETPPQEVRRGFWARLFGG
jgi:predicted transcriptional regulator